MLLNFPFASLALSSRPLQLIRNLLNVQYSSYFTPDRFVIKPGAFYIYIKH